jgi:hypothetical protein
LNREEEGTVEAALNCFDQGEQPKAREKPQECKPDVIDQGH